MLANCFVVVDSSQSHFCHILVLNNKYKKKTNKQMQDTLQIKIGDVVLTQFDRLQINAHSLTLILLNYSVKHLNCFNLDSNEWDAHLLRCGQRAAKKHTIDI